MKTFELFLYASDPTHIGAGGYRLGRVDNTIVRDTATKLPKIPGSSISGASRSAAIYSLEDAELKQAVDYAKKTNSKSQPSGGALDPVAKYFGFAEGHEIGQSRIGAFSFRDAEIVFFPVTTMAGPKWITTANRLRQMNIEVLKEPQSPDEVLVNGANKIAKLNFGWLLFDVKPTEINLPKEISDQAWGAQLQNNLALVDEAIFSSLVNGNLETRTSVSIDFETGTGIDRALFTYEAMPRGCIYRSTIEFDSARYPDLEAGAKPLLDKAIGLASSLGFGGMTTRGFGKMQFSLNELE